MAEGFSPSRARAILDGLVTAAPFIQLHTAAPGAAGTTAVATNATRKNPAFAAAATVSATTSKTTSADAQWTNVAGSEDYTHFTLWSLATGGTFEGSGLVTANPVVTGDTFTFPAGSFTLNLPNAS